MTNSPALQSSKARRFHLRVFGCQMNIYDGELIRASFLNRGWTETDDPEKAEACLFHTCSVRQRAEEKVHSLLGELRERKRRDPGLVVGVIGCMADREGRELFEREPHVDIVCGSRHFPRIPDMVARVLGGEERILALGESEVPVDAPVRDLGGRPSHWQAHVAVMRGCDMNCTFCVVPRVRGRVESRPPHEILDEVRRLVDSGTTEVHLLGQTIDAYGRDLPKEGRPSLALLLDLLADVEGLHRVRLITLHPSYVDEELADAMARSPQFLRFLPVPLQSGSDSVLRRMKRGYTMDLYRRRVAILQDRMPDLELVSDWIVGFPGETDVDFEASVAALREFKFLQSYVFQYSPRPETVAFELEDDVPAQLKRRRNIRLLEVQREIAKGRTRKMVGTASSLILEEPASQGGWKGRIHNGHFAIVDVEDGAPGRLVKARMEGWNGKELLATR